jgi:hypothetical protein
LPRSGTARRSARPAPPRSWRRSSPAQWSCREASPQSWTTTCRLIPIRRRFRRPYAQFLAAQPADARDAGARLAAAAIDRFGCPPGAAPAPGQDDAGESSAEHVLLVTHSFQVGWFVRDALDAPGWRWLGLNAQNAALTIIRYQAGLPAALLSFTDAGHLAGSLRWTGFPDALRPASG